MSYIRRMKKTSTTWLVNAKVSHYAYNRGCLFSKVYFCIFMWMTINKRNFLHTHIITCVSIIEIARVLLIINKN